ncbi:hypothetical protein [Sulfitobacter sp. R18_1]|uniref:hypothetical protein n=1 Tax=Sulfitobacter sp. R18_1 TaxID=2821104 RepID=UPI001ADA0D8D|nr:hypothetical protein [Sulfitobacter sp. R18_1]MBO9428481.1 hypothetical protein [Sulfitobacter sp. R18_1]
MTKRDRDNIANLEDVQIDAIRYGLTITSEEEEVRFASVKIKAEKDIKDPTFLVFYNDAAENVVRDLRAVLKFKEKETPDFPAEYSADSSQILTDIADKELRISVEGAKVRSRSSGAIYKGGKFEVDLSSIPALAEARDRVKEAKAALAEMEAAYAETVDKVLDGTLEAAASKIDDEEVLPAEEPDQTSVSSEVENAPDESNNEVSAPADGVADAPEEVAEEQSAEATNETPEPEAEVAGAPQEAADDNDAENTKEVKFGNEPDEGVEGKEVSLDLDKDEEKAEASPETPKVQESDETPQASDDQEPEEPEERPSASPSARPRPRPRMARRPVSPPTGPRP